MNRSVILVDLYWTRDKDPRVPLGHASLLAALRAVPGLEVHSVVVAVNDGLASPERVVDAIVACASGRPGCEVDVAFGAYVWGEDLLRAVLAGLRLRGFRGRIILGGPQVSYSGAGLEALYPEADAFVRGYGEEALASLARSADRLAIPGVHWAGTPDRLDQASVDLERLPSPWLTGLIPLDGQAFIRWETQRGCPFRCAFCQHREPGARLHHRELSKPRIAAEIDLFCRHGVREIAVLDPIFNASRNAVAVLERFARNGFDGRLSLQCRAEMLDEAFLDAAAALNVNLEFGLQTIHPDEGKAVRRGNNIAKVDRALAEVRRRGLDHEVSLIFGLPLQTLASFRETVAWCLDRRVPVIKAFPLLLLRGTALDRDRTQWGLITQGGSMPAVVASTSFDRADHEAMARLSEALRATEGHHPRHLADLERLAATLAPTRTRFQPPTQREAA